MKKVVWKAAETSSHNFKLTRSGLRRAGLVAASCMLAGLILASISIAQADQSAPPAAHEPLFPKQAFLDGRTFTDKTLALVFKQIAFSSYIAPNVFPDLRPSPPDELCPPVLDSFDVVCGTPALYKERYPWLYEYLYREKGNPRFYAINKWTGPIRISFGYPNDLTPVYSPRWRQSDVAEEKKQEMAQRISDCNGPLGNPSFCLSDSRDLNVWALPDDAKFPAAKREVEEEIKATIPVLHELTGLPVSYIPHEQETSDSFGNVRIILVQYGLKTDFKNAVAPSGFAVRWAAGMEYASRSVAYGALEPALTTAVHFTPSTDHEVEGYFLPNADNTIGMSFCIISDRNPPPVMRALVRECLVRSLGLPNAPAVGPSMILGLWNQHVPLGVLWQEPIPATGLADLPKYRELIKSWGPDVPLRTPPISDFDRFVVKTLYSPAIKPGMSVPEFYRAASQSGSADSKEDKQ